MPYSPEYRDTLLTSTPQAVEKPQDKAVFMPAMARSAGGMVRGAGHLASALGAEGVGKVLQEYGSGVERDNPAQFGGMAGFKASPWGFIKETAGELVPTVAGMAIPGGLIGKGLTKAAPALFGEGVTAQLLAPKVIPGISRGLQVTGPGVATGLGMGAASTGMETGEILGQQMDETGQYNMGRALAFGTMAGALDAGVGVGGVIRKGLTGQLGRTALKDVGLSTIGKQALKTAGSEGLQEGVQTGLEMEGTKAGGFTEKAGTAKGVDELLTSIVKGFIGGGAFGGVHGGTEYVGRKRLEADVKKQMAEAAATTEGGAEVKLSPEEEKRQNVQAALAKAGVVTPDNVNLSAPLEVAKPQDMTGIDFAAKRHMDSIMQEQAPLNIPADLMQQPPADRARYLYEANPGADDALIDGYLRKVSQPELNGSDVAARLAQSGIEAERRTEAGLRATAEEANRLERPFVQQKSDTGTAEFARKQQMQAAKDYLENERVKALESRTRPDRAELDMGGWRKFEQQVFPSTQGIEVAEAPVEEIQATGVVPAYVEPFLKLTAAQYVGATQEQKKKILRARIQVNTLLRQKGIPEEALPSVEPTALEMSEAVAEHIDIRSPEMMAKNAVPTYDVTEVAKEPSPKQVKPVQPSQSQKVQQNEKVPAQDQGVNAPPAAEVVAGARPADTRAPGAEAQRPVAGETARNGAPTNEEGVTQSAVQVGSPEAVPVQPAPKAGKGVVPQVPSAEKSAAETRNAETKETVAKRERSPDYPEYWSKQLRGKSVEQGKVSESASALDTIVRLLTDPKESKISFKGKDSDKINHALYALVSEAAAVSEPRLKKVHTASREFLKYVSNAGETWAKKVTAAQKQFEATEAKIEAEDKVTDQQETTRQAESKAAVEGRLGTEDQKPGEATITVYEDGKPKKVTEAEYKALKKEEKKAARMAAKGKEAPEVEMPEIEAESIENTVESFADAIYDGRELFHRSSHPMPNQPLYDKAVKSGDLAGIQTLIRSHFKSNKSMQRILDWVESSVGDVKLVYVNEEMTDDYGHYVSAEYDPATHSIKVYPGGANPVVMLHELVHATMERQLQEVANYKGPKTEAMLRKIKAYNDLKAQYETFKTAMPNSEAYGLTNLSEFMAEVFSNVDFRAALQTQPKTSFFRGLMRSIANFLGFKSAEQKALEDIFSAAQILAYRNPGEVFMPTEWKSVYSRPETGAELRVFMEKNFDNQTKMDIWGDKGKGVWSNAKVHVSKFLMGMSYGHNLNELFGWIPGVRDIFLTQRAQEALAKKLQDRQGFDAEMYLSWKKPNNQDHIHLWTGLTYASDFRLTQDQALAAVREVNPATHKSLLEDQKKLPKNQKLDGTNLQDTDESRRKFDAMVTHLKAIKWGEKPTRTPSSKNPANVLPKDGTTWSAQEWGEHFLRENREDAQHLYETSLLNVVFRLYKGNDQALEKLYKESTGFPEIERMFEAADNKTPRDLNEVDNIRRMRDQAMSHMYIHTHRKGEYFVSLIQPKESEGDSDKHVDFIRFESPYEAKKFAEALREEKGIKEAGYVVAYGQTSDYTHQSAVAGMMQLADQMNAHLEAMKEIEGLDQKHIDMTKDMIRQALYAMMPENSILKSYLHRKGTPGWKPDEQFEGYMQYQAQSNFHYANNRFLGKYDIGFTKIKNAIKDMEEPHRLDGMKLAQKNKDTTYDDYLNKVTKGDPIATKRLLNELLLRHTGNFVNLETPIADRWRAFTHAWQLGLAPGYLLANLMQPIQIGLPILGARYGWKDSTKALMDGYKVAVDVMGVVVNGDRLLSNFFKPRTTEDIIEALQGKFDKRTLLALTHLLNSGKVDYTLAKEAGMLSQGQSLKSIQVSRVVSSAAHYSEMLNRVAAGMAGYELETARSKDQEKAEDAMIWSIDQTQLDYNRMNQSRYLGKNSPLGRYTPLISVFMSFNIQIMELYARYIRTMIMKSKDFPGTPAEAAAAKKEAWMAFTGMLATTFTLAGAMGLPLASLAYSMASWAGGDDDEPWDFPMAMRQWATTAFGSTGGLAFTEGLPTIIGMNMSQRVGHQGLMPYSRLLTDHRTMQELPAEALVTNMSAPMATAMNLYTGMGKAYNLMVDGDTSGGDAIIKALPAALRGVGTAVYGYHDAAGQELPHEVTAWQTAMQVLGIAPRFRNDQMMLLMSDKSKEATLAKRAQYIRKGLALATQEGDADATQKFTEMSQAFVEANPRFASRMSIAPLLKKMSSDRAFYQMTGMGSTVPMNRLEEVYGLAQFLDLPED